MRTFGSILNNPTFCSSRVVSMADSLNHPLPCHAIHQYFMILGDVSQMFDTRFRSHHRRTGLILFYRGNHVNRNGKQNPCLAAANGQYPKKRTVKKEASCCRIELRQEVRFTPKKHTKVEILSEEVFRRKAEGEMNREIAQST